MGSPASCSCHSPAEPHRERSPTSEEQKGRRKGNCGEAKLWSLQNFQVSCWSRFMSTAVDLFKCLVTWMSIWTTWIALKALTTDLSCVCWLLSTACVCAAESKAWQGMNWQQSRLALAFTLTHPVLWHRTAFLEWEFWEETLCVACQMGLRGF